MGMYCHVSAASSAELGAPSSEWRLGGSWPGPQTATRAGVSLEKAWHGLHYLLTGEAWTGQGPQAFLLAGGQTIGDDDESPVRWFTPDETAQIGQALSQISDDELWSRFDPEAMEQNEIYPQIWDEPEEDLKEEYLGYFQELKQVIATAVQNGQGLVVTLG